MSKRNVVNLKRMIQTVFVRIDFDAVKYLPVHFSVFK